MMWKFKKKHNFGFWGLLETKDVSFSLANLSSQQPRKPHPNTVQWDTKPLRLEPSSNMMWPGRETTMDAAWSGTNLLTRRSTGMSSRWCPRGHGFGKTPRNENKGFNLIPNLNRENSHGVSPKPLFSTKATYIFSGGLGKTPYGDWCRCLIPSSVTEVETQQLE